MIEGLQRKGRTVWVLRMPLAALEQERLSKKLLALHLAPTTEVYVKCTKEGELTLHGGSLFRISDSQGFIGCNVTSSTPRRFC